MQLTCKTSVQSLNIHKNSPEKKIDPVKPDFLSQHDFFSNGRHLLGVSFVTILQSNLRTGLITKKTLHNIPALSSTQKTLLHVSQMSFYLETSVSGHK